MLLDLDVTVGEPTTAGSLAVFPLFSTAAEGPSYVCGPEAFAAGLVSIQELEGGGSVGTLVVENLAELPLLLLEGETLLGLKQNRTFNVSVLYPPLSKVLSPVSCVEAGRWSAADPAAIAARNAPTRVRAAKTASVLGAPFAEVGHRESDQDEVWHAVDAYTPLMGDDDEETALEAAHDGAAAMVDALVEHLQLQPGQRGLALAIDGEMVAFDLFDKASTLDSYFTALVAGYALDATGEAAATPTTAEAERFVRSALGALDDEGASMAGLGLGRELRLTGPGVFAIGLELDGTVVHLAGFASSIAGVRHRMD